MDLSSRSRAFAIKVAFVHLSLLPLLRTRAFTALIAAAYEALTNQAAAKLAETSHGVRRPLRAIPCTPGAQGPRATEA